MEVYLDNAATTRCLEPAAERMRKALLEDYGNPSSLHRKGLEAERYLRTARETIAATLGVKEKEIIFTSGGTEANNLAIWGGVMARKRRGNHIITTPLEHSSVTNPILRLEEEGFEITYLPVNRDGLVSVDALANAISEDTIFVSVMHVNNEIGVIQPIEEIGTVIKQRHSRCLFHVDAIQSYGKLPLLPAKWHVDLLSVSGHKLHGPKGTGFLYMRNKTNLHPLLLGGGHEWGLRSGTENVPGIAGLSVAAETICAGRDNNRTYMKGLLEDFAGKLLSLEGVHRNGGEGEKQAPHILNVSFDGVRSEVMLHALEEKGIYVSAGSACSSHTKRKSRTLTAIGLSEARMDEALRFSISIHTTKEELDYTVSCVEELLPTLRKYQRR